MLQAKANSKAAAAADGRHGTTPRRCLPGCSMEQNDQQQQCTGSSAGSSLLQMRYVVVSFAPAACSIVFHIMHLSLQAVYNEAGFPKCIPCKCYAAFSWLRGSVLVVQSLSNGAHRWLAAWFLQSLLQVAARQIAQSGSSRRHNRSSSWLVVWTAAAAVSDIDVF
jgi:hypothetical protein